jgi:hypothetical protein
MKAVWDTPSSDGACVYEVLSNYLERIKSYGPDKQIPYLTLDRELGVRVMKAYMWYRTWNWYATLCLVMVHVCMKYCQIILSEWSYGPDKQKVNWQIWPLTVNCDLGVRVNKAVHDTPSSDAACVYEVSSYYLERIKSYGPAKQKVHGQTNRIWHLTGTVNCDLDLHRIIRHIVNYMCTGADR